MPLRRRHVGAVAETSRGVGEAQEQVAVDTDPRAANRHAAEQQPADAICSFEPVACQRRTNGRAPTWIARPPPRGAARRRARRGRGRERRADQRAGGVDTPAVCRSAGSLFGGGDCCFEPSSANTWSLVAVPPFDDVGVPPTVIAMYCLPPTL